MRRTRLDVAMVDRGLVASRTEAAVLIAEGKVHVQGSVALKPARQVAPSDAIVLVGDRPSFVSRGGLKLQGALAAFGVTPAGRTTIDAGSSTGGFTDCLLQHGATAVVAIDVGYGQLHEKLRRDDRVISLERTNIRSVERTAVVEMLAPRPAPTLVVADLSFTSVIPICDRLRDLAGPMGEVIVLCKPQFEVGRQVAARGRGVIRNHEDRRDALQGVIDALDVSAFPVVGVATSPILGPAGNAEFLVHARAGGDRLDDVSTSIELAVATSMELANS